MPPCAGTPATGDARCPHRDGARATRGAGGDSRPIVQDDQPEREAQIQAAWRDDADSPPYRRKRQAAAEPMVAALEKGHGRPERRRLTSTTARNDSRDGPGVGPVFGWERRRRVGEGRTAEVVYGITGRGRGGRSGGCRWCVRPGPSPEVLSRLRPVVVELRGRREAPGQAAATRRLVVHPEEALPLLLT